MKILTALEMARIEKLAYEAGASEEEFMNQAGKGVAEAARRLIAASHINPRILLLCGKGNNAGDAYVAGRLLLKGGFAVKAWALSSAEESSPLCRLQQARFRAQGGEILEGTLDLGDATFLIDGILGTGFKGEVTGLYKKAIEKANASLLPILSIDIPSGIDGTTGEIGGSAIKAKETIFLGLPKAGCFLGEAWNYTGKITVYNFGLEETFVAQGNPSFHLIEKKELHLPPLLRTRHKYEAGYVVGIGGSPGMPGAPLLCGTAALHAGAGIVRILHPEGMEGEFGQAPLELIREGYTSEKEIVAALERASSVFIGPGIGVSEEMTQILKAVFLQIKKPCVIDAEALTLIARQGISPPEGAILTPHKGELKRLLGCEEEGITDLLKKGQEYVETHRITLVFKGAPTFILHPGSVPWVSDRGDPGMATAGSGDVLTGVIAAFLAQKKSPLEAAQLGVYLHGLAGERAAEMRSSYSMVASDITEALPFAFLETMKQSE